MNKYIFYLSSILLISCSSVKMSSENLEFIEKEKQDNFYVEIVDESEIKEKKSDLVLINESNSNNDDIEKNSKIFQFEKEKEDIFIENLKYYNEDYVFSDQVFKLTGINDSLEPFNRRMYHINASVDRAVIEPVAKTYRYIIPKPVRKGVSNFFSNLSEITTSANSALQLKPKKFFNSVGRFAINSTIGIAGIFDVASKIGLKRDTESFGETLGHYGVDYGSFVVLPLYGPSTVRDGIGSGVDAVMNSQIKGALYDETIFKSGIDEAIITGVEFPLGVLDTRSSIGLGYFDLNSPFEYELVRAGIYNYSEFKVNH